MKMCIGVLSILLSAQVLCHAGEIGAWKYENMGIAGTVVLDETNGRYLLIRKFHDGSVLHEELLKKDNSTYISTTIRGQHYRVKDGKLYIFDTDGLVKILDK